MTEVLFELLTLDCRVDEYGTVQYYNTLGKLHRVYGPAIEYSDGRCAWWQNGQPHRLGGPAIEWADGYRAWYINDWRLTEAEWQQAVASMESV
jgi:hypothetical protein